MLNALPDHWLSVAAGAAEGRGGIYIEQAAVKNNLM